VLQLLETASQVCTDLIRTPRQLYEICPHLLDLPSKLLLASTQHGLFGGLDDLLGAMVEPGDRLVELRYLHLVTVLDVLLYLFELSVGLPYLG
jgi:hypothetical protein